MVLTEEERADRPLTADEAAEFLRVGRSTITRLLTSGAIPAAKIGRKWLVTKADLEAFIERQKKAGPDGRGEE